MKQCTKCKLTKPLEEFSKTKKSSDGKRSRCRVCINADERQRRINYPEVVNGYWRKYRAKHRELVSKHGRRYNLRTKFGISPEVYDGMAMRQENVCMICKQPETNVETRTANNGKIYRLCVDHNHDTNTIRDLLCRNCNSIFANLNEDPNLIKSFLLYAEKWAGR